MFDLPSHPETHVNDIYLLLLETVCWVSRDTPFGLSHGDQTHKLYKDIKGETGEQVEGFGYQ